MAIHPKVRLPTLLPQPPHREPYFWKDERETTPTSSLEEEHPLCILLSISFPYRLLYFRVFNILESFNLKVEHVMIITHKL